MDVDEMFAIEEEVVVDREEALAESVKRIEKMKEKKRKWRRKKRQRLRDEERMMTLVHKNNGGSGLCLDINGKERSESDIEMCKSRENMENVGQNISEKKDKEKECCGITVGLFESILNKETENSGTSVSRNKDDKLDCPNDIIQSNYGRFNKRLIDFKEVEVAINNNTELHELILDTQIGNNEVNRLEISGVHTDLYRQLNENIALRDYGNDLENKNQCNHCHGMDKKLDKTTDMELFLSNTRTKEVHNNEVFFSDFENLDCQLKVNTLQNELENSFYIDSYSNQELLIDCGEVEVSTSDYIRSSTNDEHVVENSIREVLANKEVTLNDIIKEARSESEVGLLFGSDKDTNTNPHKRLSPVKANVFAKDLHMEKNVGDDNEERSANPKETFAENSIGEQLSNDQMTIHSIMSAVRTTESELKQTDTLMSIDENTNTYAYDDMVRESSASKKLFINDEAAIGKDCLEENSSADEVTYYSTTKVERIENELIVGRTLLSDNKNTDASKPEFPRGSDLGKEHIDSNDFSTNEDENKSIDYVTIRSVMRETNRTENELKEAGSLGDSDESTNTNRCERYSVIKESVLSEENDSVEDSRWGKVASAYDEGTEDEHSIGSLSSNNKLTINGIMKEVKRTENELHQASALMSNNKYSHTYPCRAYSILQGNVLAMDFDEGSQDSVVFDGMTDRNGCPMGVQTVTLHHRITYGMEDSRGGMGDEADDVCGNYGIFYYGGRNQEKSVLGEETYGGEISIMLENADGGSNDFQEASSDGEEALNDSDAIEVGSVNGRKIGCVSQGSISENNDRSSTSGRDGMPFCKDADYSDNVNFAIDNVCGNVNVKSDVDKSYVINVDVNLVDKSNQRSDGKFVGDIKKGNEKNFNQVDGNDVANNTEEMDVADSRFKENNNVSQLPDKQTKNVEGEYVINDLGILGHEITNDLQENCDGIPSKKTDGGYDDSTCILSREISIVATAGYNSHDSFSDGDNRTEMENDENNGQKCTKFAAVTDKCPDENYTDENKVEPCPRRKDYERTSKNKVQEGVKVILTHPSKLVDLETMEKGNVDDKEEGELSSSSNDEHLKDSGKSQKNRNEKVDCKKLLLPKVICNEMKSKRSEEDAEKNGNMLEKRKQHSLYKNNGDDYAKKVRSKEKPDDKKISLSKDRKSKIDNRETTKRRESSSTRHKHNASDLRYRINYLSSRSAERKDHTRRSRTPSSNDFNKTIQKRHSRTNKKPYNSYSGSEESMTKLESDVSTPDRLSDLQECEKKGNQISDKKRMMKNGSCKKRTETASPSSGRASKEGGSHLFEARRRERRSTLESSTQDNHDKREIQTSKRVARECSITTRSTASSELSKKHASKTSSREVDSTKKNVNDHKGSRKTSAVRASSEIVENSSSIWARSKMKDVLDKKSSNQEIRKEHSRATISKPSRKTDSKQQAGSRNQTSLSQKREVSPIKKGEDGRIQKTEENKVQHTEKGAEKKVTIGCKSDNYSSESTVNISRTGKTEEQIDLGKEKSLEMDVKENITTIRSESSIKLETFLSKKHDVGKSEKKDLWKEENFAINLKEKATCKNENVTPKSTVKQGKSSSKNPDYGRTSNTGGKKDSCKKESFEKVTKEKDASKNKNLGSESTVEQERSSLKKGDFSRIRRKEGKNDSREAERLYKKVKETGTCKNAIFSPETTVKREKTSLKKGSLSRTTEGKKDSREADSTCKNLKKLVSCKNENSCKNTKSSSMKADLSRTRKTEEKKDLSKAESFDKNIKKKVTSLINNHLSSELAVKGDTSAIKRGGSKNENTAEQTGLINGVSLKIDVNENSACQNVNLSSLSTVKREIPYFSKHEASKRRHSEAASIKTDEQTQPTTSKQSAKLQMRTKSNPRKLILKSDIGAFAGKRKRDDTPVRSKKVRRKTNIDKDKNKGFELVATKQAKLPGNVLTVRILKVNRNKALVLKRRHVNQLFVRGDNIIMVAYNNDDTSQKKL